jgi:hypothetical protein
MPSLAAIVACHGLLMDTRIRLQQALRHSTAQLIAPLTSNIALVGRHSSGPLNVTPREVNRFIAFAASECIVGPSYEVVQQALDDRHDPRH